MNQKLAPSHQALIWACMTISTVNLVALSSPKAFAQVASRVPLLVQVSTPGTQQTGNANLSGTIIAGSFIGDAAGLSGLPLSGLDTTAAGAGQVPMFDGSSVVWSAVSGSGLNLPYTGSANTVLTAFKVTNTGGEAVRGLGPGGVYGALGDTNFGVRGFGPAGVFGLSSVQTGNYGLLGTGDAGILAHSDNMTALKAEAFNSHGVDAFTHSAAHGAVYGKNMLSLNYGVLGMNNYGVYGQTADNYGVYGYATNNGGGVGGQNFSTGSRGIVGDKNYGVSGFSNAVAAIYGNSGTAIGVYGRSQSAADGVFGESTGIGAGVHGKGNIGLFGEAGSGHAVYGVSSSAANLAAIRGESSGDLGRGIWGTGPFRGVQGDSPDGSGVYGYSGGPSGVSTGVEGRSDSPNGRGGVFACYGSNGGGVFGYASTATTDVNAIGVSGQGRTGVRGTGYIGVSSNGLLTASPQAGSGSNLACFISGDLLVTGDKSFAIDHPFDPANYELRHFCTEGAEPLNAYSGTVLTDDDGFAWVRLPDYFESINKDFRYQLTVIDEARGAEFVQVRVSRKIVSNRFQVQTSRGRVEVSWRVEATRNDRHSQQNPPQDVVQKIGDRAGRYLDPKLWGQPETSRVYYVPPDAGPPSDRSTKRKR